MVPCCVADDVAVLGYAFVVGLACERQINFAPDDLTAKPVESSGGFPPLRNTKYTWNKKENQNSILIATKRVDIFQYMCFQFELSADSM